MKRRGKGDRLIGLDGYEGMVFFYHMMNGSMGGWDCRGLVRGEFVYCCRCCCCCCCSCCIENGQIRK